MTEDQKYMSIALNLARKGLGRTSPNPMVGAIVVKNHEVIGRGYHKGPGNLHAEAVALNDAGRNAAGATLYINLEPCCHTDKRTPPCTKEIIKSGVRRVVISMKDPNPMVNGKGIRELLDSGIKVEHGILEDRSRRLNEIYSKYISTRRPFVILKAASSLDGKIALPSGESKWITGEYARRCSHKLRRMVDAVLVGVGTVITDDPMLSVRNKISRGRQPLRIIADSKLRTPMKSQVLDTSHGQDTMIVLTSSAPDDLVKKVEKMGVRVLIAERGEDGRVSMNHMIKLLGDTGITSILIEGGGTINASALREGIVDKIVIMYSPRIIGGEQSVGMVGGEAPRSLDRSIFLKDIRIRRLKEDILVEGYVK